jgi:hypothetical protein
MKKYLKNMYNYIASYNVALAQAALVEYYKRKSLKKKKDK